ncbi:hypothetical protein BKA66DRAFT_323989 [Pyrenochaeta sp. MPI-SDFR-AT-0127]|nr:hypothetical protein BKA66DRAFT_323989 [Pyrenochaeta sp. MPI-SDFR-AT-0127]
MEISVKTHPKPSPTLNTLPSELRRCIVSHLTPDPKHLRPGCKRHLKNANLAHPCLREWVTEYLFRDMALIHVLPGMSSHLELFAVSRENSGLLKYVKHIDVQVPPAIRWEVGIDNPFALHLEEITKQRLCRRFRVKTFRHMTDEQQQYCANYHRALVEPFTDNRRWHQLFRTANNTWSQILRHFTHVEEISVGCCERVDQPRPTYTHTFLLEHGKFVLEDVHPRFVEDPTVNIAWASSVICRSAPPSVRSLRLSMANMDNFNSVATVNRLLSLSYRQPDASRYLTQITRLSLSLRGIAGIHGEQDWHGDTGSAGSVRFWKKILNSLGGLQHLELHNTLSIEEDLRFSELDNSDAKACILEWLLPGLVLNQLRSLRLCDFLLDKTSLQKTLSGQWPRLENLFFDDVHLMLREEAGDNCTSARLEHLEGYSWVEVCRVLCEKHPGLRIELTQPMSNINGLEDHYLHSKCIESILLTPGVVLDLGESHGSMVKPQKDQLCGRLVPLLPDVPTAAL